MKEHLLKLADEFDSLGKVESADQVENILFKISNTLLSVDSKWAAKGYLPHGAPYKKNDVLYRKYRNPSNGDIKEDVVPQADTQAPEPAISAAPEPAGAPDGKQEGADAPNWGDSFRTLLDALS